MLRTPPSHLAARIDEHGLEVGRLAALHGPTELFRDVLACLRGHRVGEMATQELSPRKAGCSLCRRVHVHEPAGNVVQARWNHEAVDQTQVDILQTVWHCNRHVGLPVPDASTKRRRLLGGAGGDSCPGESLGSLVAKAINSAEDA